MAAPQHPEGNTLHRSVLPSGLRVVTEHLPGSRSAAVGMWIAVGSRDEPAVMAGAAHYLEHLLFKGTTRRSAAAIAEEIDTVGGELNAFTTKEHPCYHAHVLDGDLDLAVDLICDVLGDARLDPSDVDLERGVILEEIAMRDDDPEEALHDEFCAALFGSHPLGRPVLGTEESVTGMSRDALHRFYRARYTPQRMVLTVAGNVSHSAALAAVRRSFGHHLAGSAPGRLGEVAVVIGDVLAELARDGLSDRELARAKGQLRGGLVLALEDAPSWMTRIGTAELDHGAHRTVEHELHRIDAVTTEEVGALARELFSQPLTAAVVGPYSAVDRLPERMAELIA